MTATGVHRLSATPVKCLCIKGTIGCTDQSLSCRLLKRRLRHGKGLFLCRYRLLLFCVEVRAKCSGGGQLRMSVSHCRHKDELYMDSCLFPEGHHLETQARCNNCSATMLCEFFCCTGPKIRVRPQSTIALIYSLTSLLD